MSIYVTLSNISFSYPSSSFSLFEDLSLSFHEGWTTILGSNGCGKSTLASLIEGSLTPETKKKKKRGNAVLCSRFSQASRMRITLFFMITPPLLLL